MAAPTDVATSESEEMYLITIAMAVEDGHEGPVPVPQLAKALGVSKVSANEMIKKLATRHLLEYLPYKGAQLSPEGQAIANTILRRRRLWSVFLSENLGLSPQAADAVACEFEHITPADVAQRLSDFLGDPRVGPQGKPIPSVDDAATSSSLHIAELHAGEPGEVVDVSVGSAERSFLADQGIVPGASVEVVAVGEDGSCLVETAAGRTHLAASAAGSIRVRKP